MAKSSEKRLGDGDSWTGSIESSTALGDKLTARTMEVRKIEICLLLIQES